MESSTPPPAHPEPISLAPPSPESLPTWLRRTGSRQDGAPFVTAACLLCPATWHGEPAMLKVTAAPEELRGVEALVGWDGDGCVRVLHRAAGATVLERAGATLRSVEPDDAVRTTILATVVRELHRHPAPDQARFVPLRRHLRSLLRDTDQRFDTARRIARELLQRNEDPVLLHGDVHAENLLASERGWLFIDPKGILGPRAFDFANIFTNWTLPEAIEHFDIRLAIVCDVAGLGERTVLDWIVVWSAVSGIWHLEDGREDAAVFPHTIMELALDRSD